MAEEVKSNRRVNLTAPSKDTKIPKIIKVRDSKEPNLYKCCYCGTSYSKLDTNFPASQSELHAGLDYHLPICRKCLDKLFEHYTVVYGGDEDLAIRRICEMFDVYYNVSLLNASRKITKKRSRIFAYISRWNLQQYKDRTYDTTLDEERNDTEEVIESAEHLEELQSKGLSNISIDILETWGSGFPDIDYKILNDHYKMLKKYNPNCDNNQEIFIKSLCHLNLIQTKALKENDTTGYIKANSEYAKTFKQAGLKTIEEKDNSNDATVGVTLATIGQYTPEEYYKDKDLYKDYDKLGEYIERHMCRPLKNLQHGTDERDFEYFVPDSNDILDGDDDE